jgi:hypothetical protein
MVNIFSASPTGAAHPQRVEALALIVGIAMVAKGIDEDPTGDLDYNIERLLFLRGTATACCRPLPPDRCADNRDPRRPHSRRIAAENRQDAGTDHVDERVG